MKKQHLICELAYLSAHAYSITEITKYLSMEGKCTGMIHAIEVLAEKIRDDADSLIEETEFKAVEE